MDSMPIIRVLFCLSADLFDLDYVTKTMGIQPTATRTRDSFRIKQVAHTEWYIEISKEKCYAISIPFDEMFRILEEKTEIINKLCRDLDLEVTFVVVIKMQGAEKPEIVLQQDHVSFAAAINAEIVFDLYCYE